MLTGTDAGMFAVPGVTWRRAWPGGRRRRPVEERHLVLEGHDDEGTVVAGRAHVRVRDGRLHEASVRLVTDDPDLPLLPRERATGGRLHAHRLGRRAVLRAAPEPSEGSGPAWVKLATPAATATAVHRLGVLRGLLGTEAGGPDLVRLLAVDPAGVLRLAPAAGTDLATLLTAGDAAAGRAAGYATGRAMAVLARCADEGRALEVGLPAHDGRTEADVLDRWIADALAFGVLPTDVREELLARAAVVTRAVRELEPVPAVPTHRDLHDGQVLVDPSGADPRVTFLDVDTAAVADPALDAANLLAHLDLAVVLGSAGRTPVDALVEGLRAGWAEFAHPLLAQDPARLDRLRAAARLRLVAVHAFRTPARRLVPLLRRGDASLSPCVA